MSLVVGLVHSVALKLLYGNPLCDRIWKEEQAREPGVKRWPEMKKYLIKQLLGTQVEVFIITVGFLWIRPLVSLDGLTGTLLLGLFFAALRIYPRTWNMWIQSTYPKSLLIMESINGTLSTFVMVITLHFLTR